MSDARRRGRLVVVGSLNVDLVTRVPRMPQPGETVTGTSFRTFVGGKGANQALAAARAGADVAMIGRVGADPFGTRILDTLVESGVDTRWIECDARAATGVADIVVDDAGENRIVVVPEANGTLTSAHVDCAASTFTDAAVVLVQLETPIDAVVRAAELGRAAGAVVICNPAPAPPSGRLPETLARATSVILPNESEAARLTGIDVRDPGSAREAFGRLAAAGFRRAIFTIGAQGAIDCDGEETVHVPAFGVDVVDTTAAGDAFAGALAASLAEGRAIGDAMRFASAAGALACTRDGAEPSLPRRADIERLLAG